MTRGTPRSRSRTATALALGALLAIGTASAAAPTAEERAQGVADTRQGLLKVVVSYFGPVVGMARGQIPFDAARVEHNAKRIAGLAPLIPEVFANDTSAFDLDTEALPEIWQDMAGFRERAATLEREAAALAVAATEGQGAAMAAFQKVGAACKGCHDNYREQQ